MSHIAEIALASLLANLPESLTEEQFDILLTGADFRLERILSLGHKTPAGQWYDQEWHEWVLLLKGAAQLSLQGQSTAVNLLPGDTLFLPAHCLHRVEWTPEHTVTVWLALHYDGRIEQNSFHPPSRTPPETR